MTHPSVLDDDQVILIEQAQLGSLAAFDELYQQTVTEVKAWVSVRSHRWEMVEECVQQTYITAHRHLSKFDTNQVLVAWLKGIARNEIGKYLRRMKQKGNSAERLLAEAQEQRLAAGDQPDQEVSVQLHRCLEKLSDRVRDLVWQRYVDNQPVEQMAEADGRSANAVSVTLHRARQSLKKCLGAA